MSHKAADLRKRIGEPVEWEYGHDPHRGTYFVRGGILEDVKGKNILVSGDWQWVPSLRNLVFEEKPKLEVTE